MVPLSAEALKVAIIRVDFQWDDSPATTGDGSFVLEDTSDIECSDWSLDPPPHGKTYFQDHLIAADNYWRRVSDGAVRIDTENSMVFPAGELEAYPLPNTMLYYHPYLTVFDETDKLFELTRDALTLADADVNFNLFSTIIIVHAGMGGDFAFALDPTPGNIPSAYLSKTDFDEKYYFLVDGKILEDIIIIPESQNFLQYEETRSLFADANDPCFYQVGLNGTMALMLGFHLGLPPLYNTETGRSLVGGFALMDQGSNNFHGIVPAYPDPYSRIKAGWVTAVERGIGDEVSLTVDDAPVKISISDDEYYLIENCQRDLIDPDDMIRWIDEPSYDTVSVNLSNSGVVIQVDEQHAGLPGNGLYIWHIDESAWFTDENPNGGDIQLVDFVEADGAQDMGHTTQLLFASYLETGWWFDPWYAANEGWFHLNRNQDVVGDSLLSFSSTTFPSTVSNSGFPSHLRIENISKNGSTMSFSIASDRIVESNSISTIIGWGLDSDYLWAFNLDSTQIVSCAYTSGCFQYTPNSVVTPDDIFSGSIDSNITFQHPWVVTRIATGIRFLNIETGEIYIDSDNDTAYEISITETEVIYFADRDEVSYIVYWNPSTDSDSSHMVRLPLNDPLARFSTTTDTIFYYAAGESLVPVPAGVTHSQNFQAYAEPPEKLDVISWSSTEERLMISHLPGEEKDYLQVDKPSYIIPLDIDYNGIFEIALFFQTQVQIITQSGIQWNGNPFSVDPYYGNPVIVPLIDGELGIFLRHENSYSIHALNGVLMDSGVLPTAQDDVQNSVGQGGEAFLLRSGDFLMKFTKSQDIEPYTFWIDPQGRSNGDRMVILAGEVAKGSLEIKSGSVYNYPNPVKGSNTTIRAWIGDVDSWSIEIFSLNGAQVLFKELDVQQVNTYNEWVWDASGVSNGVYLAQVVAGGQAEIIKIAIIR